MGRIDHEIQYLEDNYRTITTLFSIKGKILAEEGIDVPLLYLDQDSCEQVNVVINGTSVSSSILNPQSVAHDINTRLIYFTHSTSLRGRRFRATELRLRNA